MVLRSAMRVWGVVRAGKGITLVILNKDKYDIIRIIKSPDNLRALIEGTSETVKHEIKGQEGGFLAMLLGILDYSMLENMKNWKRGHEIWKRCWKSRSNNYLHNNLRMFDVLPNFTFTQKWNDARLLFINMVYTSCFTSCQTTYDLGS